MVRSGDVDAGFGCCQPRVRVTGNASLKLQYYLDGCLLEFIARERKSIVRYPSTA